MYSSASTQFMKRAFRGAVVVLCFNFSIGVLSPARCQEAEDEGYPDQGEDAQAGQNDDIAPLATGIQKNTKLDQTLESAPKQNLKSVTKTKRFKNAHLIRFDKDIGVQSERFFQRKLRAAKKQGADLVVVEFHSNGGTLEESLLIAETLRDVDWAHTVSFIPTKALSGAALASLGCDEIIMSSTSRIGDAGVIQMTEGFMFRYAPEKIRTDVVRRARDLAEAKGRSPELAEAMIDKGAVVYRLRNPIPLEKPYRIKYVLSREQNEEGLDVEQAKVQQWEPDLSQWEMIEESGPTKFLEVNGHRAVELGIAVAVVDDRQGLRKRFGLEEDFQVHKHGLSDFFVNWLNHPLITALLFIVGAIALFVELSAPGVSVGGLLSGLCFSLFFWSRFLQGTAGWLEVILFVAGVIFILVEIFVIPGFGISGISGILLMLVSVVMASQTFIVPQNSNDLQTTMSSLAIALISSVAVIGAISLLSRRMGSLPLFNRLILSPQVATGDAAALSLAGGKKNRSGNESSAAGSNSKNSMTQVHPVVSVGDWGVAESVLRPSGKARFEKFSVDVVADGSFIEMGEQVTVVEISGNRVVVKQVEE